MTAHALPELPCRDLVEVVTDYLEGALSDVDRRRFEAHLAECEGCATYVDQLRSTIAAMGGLRGDALSPWVRADLRAAFRALPPRPGR